MSKSNAIKIIGIVCIVFGAYGLLNSGLEAFIMPNMLEHKAKNGGSLPPLAIERFQLLAIGRAVVTLLYLLGGVFFLLQKTFSYKLLSGALLLSIVYTIVPPLFFREYTVYGLFEEGQMMMAFLFVGPTIDALLLLAVIKTAGMKETSDQQQAGKAKAKDPQTYLRWTWFGIAALMVPVTIALLWFYVMEQSIPREDKAQQFHSYFPAFLQTGYRISYMGVFTALAAIVGSGKGMATPSKGWKRVNIAVLILAILLGNWFLFQLL